LKAAIHQSAYFPYPGFFHKLTLADVFVIMDDVQYDKRFTNRNKIASHNGLTWITVPINKKHKFSLNSEVEINNDIDWKTEHWKKIFHAYTNSKYFHLYEVYLKNLYEKEWNFLFELNFETIKKTIEFLGIKIEIIKESELNVKGKSTERLVNVCKKIGADTYISGPGAKDYTDEKLFEKNNVKLFYQNYSHPQYFQHSTESFIPNLSIIDMLANVGPDSLKLITEKRN